MNEEPFREEEDRETSAEIARDPEQPIGEENRVPRRAAQDDYEQGSTQTAKTSFQRFLAWAWPMEFSDAVMILLTIFIAIGTVASAIAIAFQWHEMHTGAPDTTAIKDAAQRQADSAEKIRLASERNATAAEGFATSAGKINAGVAAAVLMLNAQAKATQQSAAAAQSAAETSKRSLEASERPWLLVRTSIVSPLTWDKEGAHITLHYSIANIGHSPATGINIWPEFYILNGRKPPAMVERSEVCKRHTSAEGTPPEKVRSGQTIFPGEFFELNVSFSGSQSEIEDSYRYFGSEFFVTSIVDCVTYHASFTNTNYFLGSSYELDKVLPGGVHVSFPPYIEMPVGSLTLVPDLFSGKEVR